MKDKGKHQDKKEEEKKKKNARLQEEEDDPREPITEKAKKKIPKRKNLGPSGQEWNI